jgi:hypothetical protein
MSKIAVGKHTKDGRYEDNQPIFRFIPKKALLKKLITRSTAIKDAKELRF